MTSPIDSNPPSLATVLARARAAAGGAACDGIRTLHMTGTIHAGGLSGPSVRRVDRINLRALREFTLGPAAYATGFDGVNAWRRGPNGEVTLQDAEAGLRAAVTQAWLDASGWWSPTAGAAHLEPVGTREVDGRRFDVVQALPAGGEPAQLWFDAATHLLARVQQSVMGRAMVTCLDDYREVDGARLPFRAITGSGDPRFDRIDVIERITANAPLDARDLAPPASVGGDLHFIDGRERAVVDVAVIQNTIVVPVTIAGHALRFVLDSGGVTLLTAAAAARLGLPVEGRLEAGGAGGQSATAGFVRVPRLAVGAAVVLERPLLRALDMPEANDVLGVPVDGILGAELLRRLVVRIDYEGERLELLAPAAEPQPDWGEPLPLAFFAHIPCVAATLDNEPAQFWLDTGNSGAVLLHAQAGLAPPRDATAVTTIGWGIGGAIHGRLARARSLRLGGIALAAPALRVLEDDEGALATPGLAGNIGGAVLGRFLVTFDYARRTVWLAPNARIEAPFAVDRSGLRIHAHREGFEVVAVMAGSPAEAAGLRVGDVIVDVDGTPATAIPLHAQRRAWQESAPGTHVGVGVTRAGVARAADLVLRDLVPAG